MPGNASLKILKRSSVLRRLLDMVRRDAIIPDLVARGLTIGNNVTVGQDVYLATLCPWLLTIGDGVTIGMHVSIFTHDNSPKRRIGYTAISPVVVDDRAYVGAFTIVLPGVTIGQDAIVGAGSVVREDVPAGCVAVGAPARVIGSADDFARRNRERLAEGPVYETIWAVEGVGGEVPPQLRERIKAELAGGKIGFIP